MQPPAPEPVVEKPSVDFRPSPVEEAPQEPRNRSRVVVVNGHELTITEN